MTLNFFKLNLLKKDKNKCTEEFEYIDRNQAFNLIEEWCYGKGKKNKYIIKCEYNKLNRYIAIDNSNNKFVVKEFKTLYGCKKFLLENNSYEEAFKLEEKRIKNLKKFEYFKYVLIIITIYLGLYYVTIYYVKYIYLLS